jgi:hypothetical protein
MRPLYYTRQGPTFTTGCYATLPPGCTLTLDGEGFLQADLDQDRDVDDDDFAIFQRCISGSLPGDPGCAG